jgi:hypothetical protein
VTTRITAEASTPPTTEIVTRSQNETVSSPNADATIVRRFRRYGDEAGLAFWLFLTRDWVQD